MRFSMRFRFLSVLMISIAITDLLAQGPVKGLPTLVIHGGAGTITKENLTSQKEKLYRSKLAQALSAGYAVLTGGGTSLEAVTTSLVILENSPLFNAGKGAVFSGDGKNELDHRLMHVFALSFLQTMQSRRWQLP